ncbi:MAG: nucleotide exchange factor GrpE [Acidobacteria bacterium]|jgi:molecular chaperone GrpE|nr:MAG: nucleotide exchange factor GrpE [Acidobacteriota bacterium]
MARNGKTEVEDGNLDIEHELPAGEDTGTPVQPSSDGGSEVEKLRAERDSLLDRLARSQAEFDNARKRAAKEQQDFRDYALVDTIRAIIPVLDSFDRALQSSPEKSEFHSGVELIHKQLVDALSKLGVKPISAKGEQFDPRYHEAIEMVDTEDTDDHQVLEELQRGYKLKDRLLRPAMVKVARNSRR